MRLSHHAVDLLHEVGVLGGEVLKFARVGLDVVELDRGVPLWSDSLPLAPTHGASAAAFVEFPVEELVRLLLGGAAEQRRGEAQGVETGRRFEAD